ncbi:MAG: response regulator [Desulfamplus sp.]|nr:response regulator [Desulfamplus sp.]
MKLNNMRIGTQLRLGLGIIMLLVILLGVLAWRATDLIWLQTKTFYDHPHQVRRTIGRLESNIESLARYVSDLFFATKDHELTISLQGIEIKKSDSAKQLDILYDRYLGPRDDVIKLEKAFSEWNAIRDETIWLLRSGRRDEAESRIRHDGIQDIKAETVRNLMLKIDEFARNKAEQLYQTAMKQKDSLNRQLAGVMTIILMLSLIISWLLIKVIKDPLRHIIYSADKFREGNIDIRSEYVSKNEFGELSSAFNALADTVETQMLISEKIARISDVMLKEVEAHTFCRELIKALVEHTGSQIGAVYLLNPEKTEFVHFESIGLGIDGHASFSASIYDGEFGVALASGQMQRITNIPEDTRFSFIAVGGEFKPREIITIPLFAGQEAVAVISLASLRNYGKDIILLLEGVVRTITARMNGVLAFREIQELASRLQNQNMELEVQKQELTAQTEELVEMNTELEIQKLQLDEASRLKSTFLSTMSHELRTPLNSVIVLSGVLNRRLAGNISEEELSYLEVIERNGKNLLALINDILDLSRIEAGREEINLAQFSIVELVGDVVAMIEPQAQDKNIVIVNKVGNQAQLRDQEGNQLEKQPDGQLDQQTSNLSGDDLPPIISDPDKCRHILQNLLTNAVKFTETGSVEISARMMNNEILVAVSDTGIGIAADQIVHIFEEFRQADDSASRKYGGTGLGLAIAEKYASLLQGNITVQSTQGQGSTFTLRLPLSISKTGEKIDVETSSMGDDYELDTLAIHHKPHPSNAEEENNDSIHLGRGGVGQYGQSILLVDDSEPAIIQMKEILTEQGYKVMVARNGHDALLQIKTSPPDAVILDIMMPEMDGFEVLRNIRSSEKSAQLPVLMLTAKHITREEMTSLKGNHIHQLIQKGDVSRAELLRAVAKMVTPTVEKTEFPVRTKKPVKGQRIGNKLPVILVVEDNPDNMKTIQALIKNNNIASTVIEAYDGLAGVEKAHQHVPDIILMDIALPVMDGFEAFKQIREDETLQHIPVVAVTASAMKGDKETILSYGFDGYISKPIDADILQTILQEVVHAK